ncbi:MAG TPA: hypothetical protein VNN07_14530 [Candidatus Tectomicrobia bacterium]|nr:hypothetical protein [Candidatus Tectomicrobia bacterium]
MSRAPAARRPARERGFALLAVLLVLAFVGVVGAEFAFSMRLEATAARSYKESVVATHLAEAAVEQAVREIANDYAYVGLAREGDCPLVFVTQDRIVRKRLPHRDVPLGAGTYSYCISDEEARLNVNAAPPERLARLLETLGLDKLTRDPIVDAVFDWRDANDEHRLNGAESEDTYLELPVPYRAKNANLDSLDELLQVKGVTRALLAGADGRPGLTALATVKTPGQVNINTAHLEVLRALGFSDAELSEIERSRRETPYVAVPGRFAGRGLTVTSRTFRIDAEGAVDGRVLARVRAIVQKRADAGAADIAVLEWSYR